MPNVDGNEIESLARRLGQPRKRARLSMAQVMAAAERDDGTGFCLACGNEQGGVEPDAEGYECEACGAERVAGAEQIIIGAS